MTVHTTRITLTAASLLALGLTSCAAPGTPEPGPSPSTRTEAQDPFHVDRPKNLAAATDPCQLLSAEQVGQLGAGAPSPGQSEWKQASCRWNNELLSVNIAPDTVQGQGLRYAAKIYGDQDKPTAKVNGYPALHIAQGEISCSTGVGVNDTQMFLVQLTVGTEGRGKPEFSDPCAVSDKIAGMVLENLPPA